MNGLTRTKSVNLDQQGLQQ